jgi:hypothetical protein
MTMTMNAKTEYTIIVAEGTPPAVKGQRLEDLLGADSGLRVIALGEAEGEMVSVIQRYGGETDAQLETIRLALARVREGFVTEPPQFATDQARRKWSRAQLAMLRGLIERAEAQLDAERDPENPHAYWTGGADEIAIAAAEYHDAQDAMDRRAEREKQS